MSTVKQRKTGKNSKKQKGKSKSKSNTGSSNNASPPKSKKASSKAKFNQKPKGKPLIPLPLIFRMVVSCMFLFSVYAVKRYYVSKYVNKTSDGAAEKTTTTITGNLTIDDDFNDIINVQDVHLDAATFEDISPRITQLPQTASIPNLRVVKIDQFWSPEMALHISNQIYQEFMNPVQRNESFLFSVNRGNEKIRGNDNIHQKTLEAHAMHKYDRFSYCKYEYRRSLPLYQQLLSYLNSSEVTRLMSKVFDVEMIGVSDLFVSVYYKDNFLSTHDDRGLGHYAFVSFLSQDWNFDDNGGALNFNCAAPHKRQESCLEIKFGFNENVFFKVWPDSVSHFVTNVKVNKPRIAITGWYFTHGKGVHWPGIAEETGYGEK